LIGLDVLKKHQCNINLGSNCLMINNGKIKVPFLTEAELKQGRIMQN
jgi:hypothetical protein